MVKETAEVMVRVKPTIKARLKALRKFPEPSTLNAVIEMLLKNQVKKK